MVKKKEVVKIAEITYEPPKDLEAQNKLAHEMVDWALTNENALCIDSFPVGKKYSPSKFYYIARINPKFSDALELAKAAIGARLVHLWKNRKVEKDFCLRLLPMYNKAYYEYTMEKTFNEAKGKAQGSTIQVVMDPIDNMQLPLGPEGTN